MNSFKLKVTIGAIIAVVVIIAILMMNKKKMQAKIQLDKTNSFLVSVMQPTTQQVNDYLSVVGTVQANNEIALLSETQGRVTSMRVKVGSFVSVGTVIATVDDELKKASYTTAKVSLDKAKKDLQRFEALYKEKNATENDLENARLNVTAAEAQFTVAQRQLKDATIVSHASGVVTDKFISVGSTLSPGSPIANIVDVNSLKIRVNVPESDVQRLKSGSRVDLTSDLYPNKSFSGKVESIVPKGDDAHTFPVEITFSNTKDLQLKAGMFARVNFTSLGNRVITVIPRSSVIGSVKEAQVYVVEGNIAKIRNIVIGKEYGDKVEVIGGVTPNDQIVIAGQNNLSDGIEVKISNK